MIRRTTTVKLQSITQTRSRLGSKSSEHLHASGSILLWANTTGNVGCGNDHLLNVLSDKVRVFLWSNINSKGWVQSTQQVQLHPQRGNNRRMCKDTTRIRLGFIYDKARFYTCKGLFSKGVFTKHLFSKRIDKWGLIQTRIQVLMLSDSPSAVAHGTTARHFQNQLTP
jgi:hypothetical protein